MVDFGFVEQETADLYSPDQGRPSYPPEQLFRLLVVAYLEGLSDVEVVSQVRYNLVYRYFCRFGLVEPTPDDTTLVVFRRRLRPERFERLFAQVVQQAQAHGLLAGTYKLVDATVVRADAALRNRAELLREGRRRLVKALARHDPERAARVAPLAEPAPREGQPYRAVLAEEEARTVTLLRELADVSDPAVAGGREELRKVYTGEGGVASFTDPDARWGFKKKDEPFLGYKAHVSCDASGIVTAVQTLPGNAPEGEHLADLLATDAELGVTARCVVADKAYDSAANRRLIRDHGMDAAIPERHRHKIANRFRYRPRKDVLRCPAGKESAKAPTPAAGTCTTSPRPIVAAARSGTAASAPVRPAKSSTSVTGPASSDATHPGTWPPPSPSARASSASSGKGNAGTALAAHVTEVGAVSPSRCC